MNRKCFLSLIIVFWACSAFVALADERKQIKSPEILTTDLLKRQKVVEKEVRASFVVVDDYDIVSVTINGEVQNITPGKIVTIEKLFNLKTGRNAVKINARNSLGGMRERIFIIAYGDDVEILPPEKVEEKKFQWFVIVGGKYDIDSNPSNDLGVPIDTGDVVVEGIVDDKEQDDVRITKNAILTASYGGISGFIVVNTTEYEKDQYQAYNTEVLMVGAGYTPKPDRCGVFLGYFFLDLNNDGYDTLQSHTTNLGYQFGYIADNGSNSRWLFSLVWAGSEFADPTEEPSSTGTFKWEYVNLDEDRLDKFHYVFGYGSSLESSEEDIHSFWTMDFQWSNKWRSGVLFDIGFAFGQKEYPNQAPLSAETPFGDKRVDVPLSYNNSLGFTKWGWTLKLNYEYSFNLSNKSPSVRDITGIELSAVF